MYRAGAVLVQISVTVAVLISSHDALPVKIGEIETRLNIVSGAVYAKDDRTLEVRDFVFDGLAPDAYFWGNTESIATARGFLLFDNVGCGAYPLREFAAANVTVELPLGKNIDDLGYFSVWSRAFELELGGLRTDRVSMSDLAAGPSDIQCTTPSEIPQAVVEREEPFPVAKNFNCETLLDDIFQVRWKVHASKITIELVGRVNNRQFLAFGPSGSSEKSSMIGSDPAIGFLNNNGGFTAVDYFVSSKSACEGNQGVCPDDKYTNGSLNLYDVSGSRTNDLVRITYTRALNSTDTITDRVFESEKNKATYVTWAIGSVEEVDNVAVPLYREVTTMPQGSDVAFAFGRNTESNCPKMYSLPSNESGESIATPWNREVIMADPNDGITARLGPAGGMKGLPGLLGREGMDLGWYMNDILAATIGVERGKTYQFLVYGGNNEAKPDEYHPFYITSDSEGGRARKNEAEKQNETILAGAGSPPSGGVTGALCLFRATTETDFSASSYQKYFKTLDTTCRSDTSITSAGGSLNWTVTESTPDVVYYQSHSTPFMGWKILVFDSGEINYGDLEDANIGDNVLAQYGASECGILLNGAQRYFDGCFKDLPGDFKLYWTVDEDTETIETLFQAKPDDDDGYVAWSWGRRNMAPGNAVVAFRDPESGNPAIFEYSLQGKSSSEVDVTKSKTISKEEVEIGEDGTVTGYFAQPVGESMILDKMDAIWALGPPAEAARTLREHSKRYYGTLNLSATSGSGVSVKKLDKVWIQHGIIMGIAWQVLVPLAMFVMRYLKKFNPLTFYIHRGLAVTAFAAAVSAYILGLVKGGHDKLLHLILGSAVILLALFQVASGLLRPRKESEFRPMFYFAHSWSGRVSHIIAQLNIFIGLGLANAETWLYILSGAMLALYGAFCLVFGVFMSVRFPTREMDANTNAGVTHNETDEKTGQNIHH